MESEKLEAEREHLISEIERCQRAIEGGDSDPWWREDLGRFQHRLRCLDKPSAALTPPVDGGEFVMVPREADGWTQYERGIQAAEMWLRDQQHKLPPETLWHAAAILADRMNVELLPASPSRPSPSAEQREAALHAAVRATYPGRSLHADPIQDTERAYWNPLLDAILAALYPDRGE